MSGLLCCEILLYLLKVTIGLQLWSPVRMTGGLLKDDAEL